MTTKSRVFRGVKKKVEETTDENFNENEHNSIDIDGLIEDIEDYINDSMKIQTTTPKKVLPPVLKFNRNWSLSVTELSCQLWCEKQVEFTLITGRKRVTEAMESGTKRHEELELEDHEIMDVEIETNEDNLGIRMLNTIELIKLLLETGKCREMWLFGKFGHYIFSGIIDQLTIQGKGKNKTVVISDTKTRSCRKEPSIPQMQGSSLQVQAYCVMLENSCEGDLDFGRIYQTFRCDRFEPFVAPILVKEGCLAELELKYLKAFKKLPKVSTTMEISYEHEGEIFSISKVDLNKQSLLYTIHYLCEFWDGKRESEPVRVC